MTPYYNSIRYPTSRVLAIFDVLFKPYGKERRAHKYTHPCFYQGDDPKTVIFPPATDNPEGSKDNESIQTMLDKAREMLREEDNGFTLDDKILVFPIIEALPHVSSLYFDLSFLKAVLPSRMHMVTLHYDPSTRVATVIDPVSNLSPSLFYSLSHMKHMLEDGGLVVDSIDIRYQGIQKDWDSCGPWSVLNIKGFAQGISIDEQMDGLTGMNIENVLHYFNDLLNFDIKDKQALFDVLITEQKASLDVMECDKNTHGWRSWFGYS
jgi:hypothetical protein